MIESSPEKNKLESPDRSVGMYAEVYSGALPHPKHLAEYDEIVPGYAKKILDKAMEQTDHRIDIETRVIPVISGMKTRYVVRLCNSHDSHNWRIYPHL